MSCDTEEKEVFLTHHNLQGSQTTLWKEIASGKFLTHHNLQGSQTNS